MIRTSDPSQANNSHQDPVFHKQGLTIGQLAKMTGINAKAIRYYESIGLLPLPQRGDNSYRRYGFVDVNRLLLLRRIRQLGIPLSAAKSLLIRASDARCIDVQHELLTLVDKRLTILDREIAELQQFRAEVVRYQHALVGCQPDESELFSACQDVQCIDLSSETCCGVTH